jgi:hypothetical protein
MITIPCNAARLDLLTLLCNAMREGLNASSSVVTSYNKQGN